MSKAVFNSEWIQDGFGPFFKARIKNVDAVADYMGNSPVIVKRHYARTIPAAGCQAFWALTPQMVLADETKANPTPPSHTPGVGASEHGISKEGVPPPIPVRNAEPIF